MDYRLKKLPQALVENGGKMGPALLAVGYAKGYASNPQKIKKTKAYQKVMKPLLDRLEEARDAAIERMAETVSQADYNAVAGGLNITQKQIQLLKGDPTENIKSTYSDLDDAKLKAIVARASAASGSGTGEANLGPETPD